MSLDHDAADLNEPLGEPPLRESERIAERMRELCARDDAPGVLRFLERQNASSGRELAHSKRPIEYAIAQDAERVFEALLDLSQAESGDSGGLRLRLWGGLMPAHQCAYVEGELGEKSRCATQCLKVALRREPMLAFWRDEDDRSVLDWAAMSEDATAFALLLNSLRRAQAQGRECPEPLDQLLSKAVILAVSYAYDPPFRLAQLEAISALGFDWRAAKSAQGQSALARCLRPLDSPHFRNADAMAALLIEAGAPLGDLAIAERSAFDPPSPTAPLSCLEALFNPSSSRWRSYPKAFRAALGKIDDSVALELLDRDRPGVGSLASMLESSSDPAAALALARREAALIRRHIPSTPAAKTAKTL